MANRKTRTFSIKHEKYLTVMTLKVKTKEQLQVPGDRYMAPTNSRKGGAMYLSPGT
jgi:hypothetical protein